MRLNLALNSLQVFAIPFLIALCFPRRELATVLAIIGLLVAVVSVAFMWWMWPKRSITILTWIRRPHTRGPNLRLDSAAVNEKERFVARGDACVDGSQFAEWILALSMTRERAEAVAGDLREAGRGALWFWRRRC